MCISYIPKRLASPRPGDLPSGKAFCYIIHGGRLKGKKVCPGGKEFTFSTRTLFPGYLAPSWDST